jgi:hypothetical protein
MSCNPVYFMDLNDVTNIHHTKRFALSNSRVTSNFIAQNLLLFSRAILSRVLRFKHLHLRRIFLMNEVSHIQLHMSNCANFRHR